MVNRQFERLCKKDYLLDGEDKQRWDVLERNVESGAVDSRDLRIKIEEYKGPTDRYQDVLGPLKAIDGSQGLFRQDILVLYRKDEILRISNVIAIQENLIAIYAPPFSSRSCYSQLVDFDRVINRHFY